MRIFRSIFFKETKWESATKELILRGNICELCYYVIFFLNDHIEVACCLPFYVYVCMCVCEREKALFWYMELQISAGLFFFKYLFILFVCTGS